MLQIPIKMATKYRIFPFFYKFKGPNLQKYSPAGKKYLESCFYHRQLPYIGKWTNFETITFKLSDSYRQWLFRQNEHFRFNIRVIHRKGNTCGKSICHLITQKQNDSIIEVNNGRYKRLGYLWTWRWFSALKKWLGYILHTQKLYIHSS